MKPNLFMKIVGRILSKDKYPLDANGYVNLELGITGYQDRNDIRPKEENVDWKIWIKVIENSKDYNITNPTRLKELNSQTRFILNGRLSAKTKVNLLEKIGYEVIK